MKINSLLRKFTKKTEERMNKILVSHIDPSFHALAKHQIKTGGKKMRPMIAVACCRMLGGKDEDVYYPAAGLEILHNCSLIVDDIVDNSVLRRGKPTVWVKYGRSIAQCIAMDYSVAIFEAAGKSKKPVEISNIFIKTLKTIMSGEIMDILFEQAGREEEPYIRENRCLNIREKDFLEMVERKTATLIQASCEVGGICADASKEEIRKLKRYGFNIGMAFQISDDLLDIFGKEEKLGKKIGKDIEERKGGNCVIYFASQEFSPKEKDKFWKILIKKKIKKQDVKTAIEMIKKTNAREKAFKFLKSFIKKAEKSLSSLTQNEWNDFLIELADVIMRRQR